MAMDSRGVVYQLAQLTFINIKCLLPIVLKHDELSAAAAAAHA